MPVLHSIAEVPWLQPYPDRLLDEIAPTEEQPDAVVVARETIELTYIAVIQLLPAAPARGADPARRARLVGGRDRGDARDVASPPPTARCSAPARRCAEQRAASERPAELSPDEQRLLEGFIAGHETGDFAAATKLMREDIRVTMPPHPMGFEGRDEVLRLSHTAVEMGDWRLVPTRANRQPGAASYLRRPGDTEWRAFKLDVLRCEDAYIAEITTFNASLFGAFGLKETL